MFHGQKPGVDGLLLALGGLFCLVTSSIAKPARQIRPHVDLNGFTVYGAIEQKHRSVTLSGPIWRGDGKVRNDGRVEFVWTQAGQVAIGLYEVNGNALVGHWGWIEDGMLIDDAGDICSDRLFSEEFSVFKDPTH